MILTNDFQPSSDVVQEVLILTNVVKHVRKAGYAEWDPKTSVGTGRDDASPALEFNLSQDPNTVFRFLTYVQPF